MPRPCIISLGDCVYRLDDGPLVLVGTQQDRVLQAFAEEALIAYNASRAFVRLRTRIFRSIYDPAGTTDLSEVMKSLKRGPLGAAIELPRRRRGAHGYGYRVHIEVRA